MFDGMNGQSGFYTLIIFIFFILNNMYLNLSLVILICCVFFIFFNLKNKIFLGDNGSLLLSLLISLLIINTYNERNDFFCDEIFILMMIPGFDLIRLFFIRISKKKNPMSADKNHLHHILIKKYSHKKVLLINFLLISAPMFLYFYFPFSVPIIITTAIIYIFLISKAKI